MGLIDIHRHLPAGHAETSCPCGEGTWNAVIQTGPGQQGLLARWPRGVFSVGLHPWHIPDSREATGQLLDQVAQMAQSPAVRLIGETGLDSMRRRFVSDAAFGRQADVLAAQADLADQLGKPLLLHVVRRYDEVLRLHRNRRPEVPWIVHGFARSSDLLQCLLEAGFHVSFGAALLSAPQVADAWQQADLQRVFLETDDSGVPMELLLDRAARLRHMPSGDLARQLERNAADLGLCALPDAGDAC